MFDKSGPARRLPSCTGIVIQIIRRDALPRSPSRARCPRRRATTRVSVLPPSGLSRLPSSAVTSALSPLIQDFRQLAVPILQVAGDGVGIIRQLRHHHQRLDEFLEIRRLLLPRLVTEISSRHAGLPDLLGVAGGAAVGAINLQAERRVAGALQRPVSLDLRTASASRRRAAAAGAEHKAAPRSAERDERGQKNGETGFHDFTSDGFQRRLDVGDHRFDQRQVST